MVYYFFVFHKDFTLQTYFFVKKYYYHDAKKKTTKAVKISFFHFCDFFNTNGA